MAHRIGLATKACVALAESLDAAGVPFEVLGHMTHIPNSDAITAYYDFDDEKDRPIGRVESVLMPLFKSFNQTLRQARGAMGAMESLPDGANADADAILMAGERLLKRREKRKILMVLSDGEPAWRSRMKGKGSNWEDYANQLTRDVVHTMEAKGIETVGIGIQSTSVASFYERHAVVSNMDDLGKQMLDQLGKVLLGNRFKADNKDLIQAREGARRAIA
jgi:cobalamin biosynthesis protein CobT